jgi:proton-dependent oligopeptide transporter, POT family
MEIENTEFVCASPWRALFFPEFSRILSRDRHSSSNPHRPARRMVQTDQTEAPSLRTIFRSTTREIIQPFIDLIHVSRGLWAINVSYVLEGLTYFGVLGLLAIFFNEYIGLNDIHADLMVSFLSAGITLAMLILGATVDLVGPRKALLISLGLMLVGRVLLTLSPTLGSGQGLWSTAHLLAVGGILWIILGYGIYQPACYAAVKFFTTEKTAAMGYAMLYALMNLGGFLPGLLSPPVRKAYGITGVFWVYSALTLIGMAVIAFVLTTRAVREAAVAGAAGASEAPKTEKRKPFGEQILYYVRNFPIRDSRFLFFIFILIPVQTLFAHNWLTLPQYCNRAFTGVVSENYEFFVNFAPLLIFVLTPVVTALTSKKKTYTMMIAGTLVMAAPTFLLVLGPNIVTLFAFLVGTTIGEAMWSPRFLQWIAEVAPKDMTGIYMGLGQFPWFLTKVITGLYAGWFLSQYCPAGVSPAQTQTEIMWFIYGVIALITPVGLWLAKGWMMKGFKEKADG